MKKTPPHSLLTTTFLFSFLFARAAAKTEISGAIDLPVPSARYMLPPPSNQVSVAPQSSSPAAARCFFLILVPLVAVNSAAFSNLVRRTTNFLVAVGAATISPRPVDIASSQTVATTSARNPTHRHRRCTCQHRSAVFVPSFLFQI
ncbi:unnamed protein product [Linum trigynum]|uniref:Secreted protein n=1 Tax=Linum trigynum TaxID=586398 RepID=A0AAV2GL28_9ROSI